VTSEPKVVDVRALLFDNDGVLIDSAAAVEASWRAFADWYDLPVDELLTRVHGRRSREVVDHYADRLPVSPDEAFRRYVQACVRDYADVQVLPGAAELLTALPAAGWAVVTSGTRVVAEARMAAAGLPEPPVFITAEDVSIGKPDPAPYSAAAARLGLEGAECLAIEDAPAGVESGKRAGCRTLALLTTHERRDLDADIFAPNLTAVRVDGHERGFTVQVQDE
jgi:mannitol-1-/sugar-/sorbitol-6-phosphatase